MKTLGGTSPIINVSAKVFITVGEDEFYVQEGPNQRLVPLQNHSFWDSPGIRTHNGDFRLATVINWTGNRFSYLDLQAVAENFAHVDDVWNRSFLAVIIVQASPSTVIDLPGDCEFMFISRVSSCLPDGPYVLHTPSSNIFAISKLFEDKYNAFIGGGLKSNGRIAVPSRLYFEKTITKPLAGLRFAVKDIIDVAGLETGHGNRSYRSLYQRKTVTAPSVQRLMDAGAVLVGKTVTTQFAGGQEPVQWFDYQAPFNPRGDMCQKPSSSSSGSAVASAAYPWIDFTVGTDTGGSIRHPAGVCGIYGMRPSLDAVSTEGVYSVSTLLDTVGLFARSATTLELASKILFQPSFPILPISSNKKYRLLYPTQDSSQTPTRWFPSISSYSSSPSSYSSSAALIQFESFIQALEAHLHCSRFPFNLDHLWRDTNPIQTLDEATGTIYTTLTTSPCIRQTIDPFIAAHRAVHTDRLPFFDPIVRARHDLGRSISDSQFESAVASAQAFKTWVLDVLLATTTTLGNDGSDEIIPLLVFPQSWGVPNYRTAPVPEGAQVGFSTFSAYSLSYLSGCPDFTVPVGEVPFVSDFTGVEEMLPVAVSVVGRVGDEGRILALLRVMEERGELKDVKAGRQMYAS